MLPKFVKLHTGLGVTRVGPIHKLKLPFTYTDYDKALYTAQAENKYSKGVLSFLLNGYVYVIMIDPNMIHLTHLNVRGVLASPADFVGFKCDMEGTACFSFDDDYPINNHMIPYLKEQVLAQLGLEIELEFPVSLENELLSDEKKDQEPTTVQPNETTAGAGQ